MMEALDQKSPRDITPHEWQAIRSNVKAAGNDPLLAYQRKALALCREHSVCVVEKGRRTGLTWTFALHAVMTASARHGQNVFYMGYNHEMAREFIKVCGEWAETLGTAFDELPGQLWQSDSAAGDAIQVFRVRFASGFTITALPRAC